MSTIVATDNQIPEKWNPADWEKNALRCQRDLVIKKTALAIICLINIAGITALCAYLVLYTPFSQTTLEISALLTPIIIGVFAALSIMKVPTFGLNSSNYKSCLNPLTTVAKVVTLIFFGPIFLMKNKFDFNDYGDPAEAKCVKKGLSSEKFEEVMESFGPRITNLVRYGYIDKKNGEEFKQIYLDVKPLLRIKKYLKEKETIEGALEENIGEVQKKINAQKEKWDVLKQKILPCLPEPPVITPDYHDFRTKVKLVVKEYLNPASLQKIKLH